MTGPSRNPAPPARRRRDALEPLAAQGFISAIEPLQALGLFLELLSPETAR